MGGSVGSVSPDSIGAVVSSVGSVDSSGGTVGAVVGSVLVSPVVGLMVSVGAVGLLSVGTEASSVGEVVSVLGSVGSVWLGVQAVRETAKQRASSRDRVFIKDFIFIPPSVLDF